MNGFTGEYPALWELSVMQGGRTSPGLMPDLRGTEADDVQLLTGSAHAPV